MAGDDRGIRNAVTDASSLYRLRKDAPPDGEALARRAAGDFVPVIDALWGAGYYNATVTISLGAASLTVASSDVAAFARAADSYRNRAVAPVAIKVDPGPLFQLAHDTRRQRRRRRVLAGRAAGPDRRSQARRSGGRKRPARR